ncbi:Protein of unknown function (DUF2911) [Chitinophaga dinghuensis]|uniref:DUF2911 domain-containing protein n=1 Tax=Chitinophaga dinghuensis TaxID=1539050 RepID=A0A327VVE2_9BACT|nr:DUF2911 domain-containing protein [Chitinophaga dinghuensis]RAJ79210.1 Protein of unknown function (DUF2911) [Chitinophaga dinghuensis]
MKTARSFAAAASCAFLLYAGASIAQVKVPAPSPSQTVKQEFALSNVELSYSRPNTKGRVIMGDLVPYNKVWRTGANSATTITFGEDVKFGGVAVKAGKYGLVTIPGQQKWTVILTSSLDVTKPADYKQENDIARVTVTPVRTQFSQESFTIGFENVQYNSMVLALSWDKVKVPVVISADIDGKIEAQIDAAMQTEKKPYFQAAMFYADQHKDLKKAVSYIDQAADAQPDAFWVMYQKARIHSMAKDNATAKAAAQKSLELATAAKSDDYVALNKKLLATLK